MLTAGALSLLVSASYAADGQVLSREFGHGVTTGYTYEPISRRLATLSTTRAAAVLQDYGYGYDPAGNILTWTDAASGALVSEKAFGYDSMDRLVATERDTEQESYGYDASGRMTAHGVWTDYRYELAGNRHAVTSLQSETGLRSYEYDADGLLTSDGGRVLLWDAAGHLGEVLGTSYRYDAGGQRWQKLGPEGETVYVGQLFEARRGGAERRYRVWLGEEQLALLDIDEPLSGETLTADEQAALQSEYGKVLYLHKDHLGTTSVTTRGGASVSPAVSRRDYWPYGREAERSGTPEEPRYEFTGKERDDESGYDYFGARYYESRLGGWLAPDPAYLLDPTSAVDQPMRLVLYGYAGGKPLRRYDVQGEDWKEAVVGVTVGTFDALTLGGYSKWLGSMAPEEMAYIDQQGDYQKGHFAGGMATSAVMMSTGVGAMAGGVRLMAVAGGGTLAAAATAEVAAGAVVAGLGPGAMTNALREVVNSEGGGGKVAETAGAKGGERAGKPFKDSDRIPRRDAEPKCDYCGQKTTKDPGKPNTYNADHGYPKSKGGSGAREHERT